MRLRHHSPPVRDRQKPSIARHASINASSSSAYAMRGASPNALPCTTATPASSSSAAATSSSLRSSMPATVGGSATEPRSMRWGLLRGARADWLGVACGNALFDRVRQNGRCIMTPASLTIGSPTFKSRKSQMREREPSRTALAAATHRAVHQVVEQGKIFSDPLALTILGMNAKDVQRELELQRSRRGIRLFVAARSRFAEEALGRAVEQRCVRQIVVLGAGLDTFAYRTRLPEKLRVFEVDHPATQAWKRRRLEEVAIEVPDSLIYAPIDFESDTLLDGLNSVGFDASQRTFFTWLGVVPYLTEKAIDLTLGAIANLAGGAEVVFDYSNFPASLSPELLALHEERAARVAAVGEPFLTYFESTTLHGKLRELGFAGIDDVIGRCLVSGYLGQEALAARSSGDGGQPRSGGGHVLFAATKLA